MGNIENEISAILHGLEIPETDPVAKAWLGLPGTENSMGLLHELIRGAWVPASCR